VTRVLVVDDSALMRKHLREILVEAGGFEVATARDGVDALEQLPRFEPEVITLDINMPAMDGLTCLSHIMTSSPRPVLMVSSLTEKGALATLEALHLGAVDYVCKPSGTVSVDLHTIGAALVEKVRAAAAARPRRPIAEAASSSAGHPAPRPAVAATASGTAGVVLVGTSTGGPRTLEQFLPALPASYARAVVVAQHMPANFTKALATRLAGVCRMPVEEVTSPVPVDAGRILIGRGDADLIITARGGRLMAAAVPADPRHPWHPSVDRLVWSAMEHVPPAQLIGVLLTGMGNDGAAAMRDLRRAGGHTVAESEASSVVFGMPKELIACGGAEVVLSAERIAGQLSAWA
jgi:two-component system chemotaxis response regulator CheB